MLSVRIMVAGAALVAGTLVASPADAACDRRFAWTCASVAEQTAPAAKTEAAPERVKPATKRPIRGAKAKDRARKHAHSRKSRSSRMARSEPRASPATKLHHPVSASTRRFREIVSPRPISSNPIDDLRKPRADTSALAASMTYPTGATGLQTAVLQTRGEGIASSQDELNEIDLAAIPDRARSTRSAIADAGAPAAQATPIRDIARAAASDQAPANATWLQLIFVTWGGILTLASLVRLFIG